MAAGEKLNLLMKSQKGKPNGVASLDSTGKVPAEQHPDMNYHPIDGGTLLGEVYKNNINTTSPAEPVNDTDATNKGYVDEKSIRYGTCDTAGITAAKVVPMSGFTLKTGAMVLVKFTNTNTSTSATLNVNNTGAKSIWVNGSAVKNNMIMAGMFALFEYDGTYWQLLNPAPNSMLVSPTFTGTPKAPGSATDYTTARIRNIRAGTDDMTANFSTLNSGEIYLVYE